MGQKEKAVVVCNKHVSKMLAEDAPMWKRRRLTRPTLEEEEKSRVTAGLPSHVYVIPVRREEKMRQEEARRIARVLVPGWNNPTVPQGVKPGQVTKTKKNDNKTSLKIVSSSSQMISESTTVENASSMNSIDDIAKSKEDESCLTKTSIPNSIDGPKILHRVSPEKAVSDLVNNTSRTKTLTSKTKLSVGTISSKTSKKSSEDFWVLEQPGSSGDDDKFLRGDVFETNNSVAYPIAKEENTSLMDTSSQNKVQNIEHESIEERMEVAHFLEAKEVLEDEELAGCNIFWPQGDHTQGCAIVEGQDVPEGNSVETVQCPSNAMKKFCCMECGKELNTKNGLDYHMRTHSGAHPFQCEICLKRFKSSSLCSRHRQIHSSDKKFSCKICGKGFAQKSNLSKHMDIHAGVRPFQVHSILAVT